MTDESRFIDGVYNYCDRWCERCPFTQQCRVYAMEEEALAAEPESHDLSSDAFWKGLRAILQQTKEMVLQTARERGIDLNCLDLEAAGRQEARRRRRTRKHPLTVHGLRYARAVDRWFGKHEATFRQREEELNRELRLGLPGHDPEAAAVRIGDAVDVVRWYQHQIGVKLARAVSSADLHEDLRPEEPCGDADGSAKVALIGIDRSLAAWSILRRHLSDPSETILDLLVQLDRLRRAAESTFPNARAFVRPGFDEEDP
jgi:hypothetical protein